MIHLRSSGLVSFLLLAVLSGSAQAIQISIVSGEGSFQAGGNVPNPFVQEPFTVTAIPFLLTQSVNVDDAGAEFSH